MPEIAKTLIATSSPLDICEGLAVLPANLTLRFGRSVYLPLVDKSVKIGKLGFSFGINVNAYVGVCGPAYAVDVQAEGQVSADGQSLSLDLGESHLQAGTLLGDEEALAVETSVNLGAGSKINLNFEVKFSLLELIIDELLKLITSGSAQLEKINTSLGGNVTNALSTLDTGGGDLASAGRDVVNPSISATVDTVPIIVGVAGDVFGIVELGELFKELEEFSIEVAFGPTLGFTFPTQVSVSGAALSDAAGTSTYTLSGPVTAGKLAANLAAGQRPITAPQRLGLQFTHEVGLDFTFGLFFEVSFLKVFKIGAKVDISVLGLLEDAGAFAQLPFAILKGNHTVFNTIGAANVAAAPAAPSRVRPVQVRFEAPLEVIPA